MFLPLQAEIHEHKLNLLPFTSWCPNCAQGEGVSAAHKRRKIEKAQVPVIAEEYMGVSNRDAEEGENPIMAFFSRKTKVKYANVLKNNGDPGHYAREGVASDMVNMVYGQLVYKSDQGPATSDISIEIAVLRKMSAIKEAGVQIIPDVSPVGESQSNGEVESAVKQVQGQYRTMRLHVQTSYKNVIPEDSEVSSW